MRKISANYIFPINSPALKNGVIYISDTGYIIKVIDTEGKLKEISSLEFYNGAIIPGIIISDNPVEDYNKTGIIKLLISLIKQYKLQNNHLRFNEYISELTLNKARNFNLDNTYGSIEAGKKPGILLIENFDFQAMDISEKSQLKILVPCQN